MVEQQGLTGHAATALRDYDRVRSQYERCAVRIQDMLTSWLDEEQINYQSVSARAKTRASFKRKAARPSDDDATQPRYDQPLTQITDLMGARVITYLPESVDRVCEVVAREFDVSEHEDKGQLVRDRGLFGYASKHFLVRIKPDRAALPEYKVLSGKTFEIQVRTAAQHAWAEFEHDVRYKVAIPLDRKAEFDRRFTLAAALVELADAEFTAIEALYRELAVDTAQEERYRSQAPVGQGLSAAFPGGGAEPAILRPLDPASLMNWLTERYSDASRSKAEHYAWMLGVLRHFGLDEAGVLESTLGSVKSEEVAAAMNYRFSPGQVRRLDDDLLAALGKDYVNGQPDRGDRRRSLLSSRLELLLGAGG